MSNSDQQYTPYPPYIPDIDIEPPPEGNLEVVVKFKDTVGYLTIENDRLKASKEEHLLDYFNSILNELSSHLINIQFILPVEYRDNIIEIQRKLNSEYISRENRLIVGDGLVERVVERLDLFVSVFLGRDTDYKEFIIKCKKDTNTVKYVYLSGILEPTPSTYLDSSPDGINATYAWSPPLSLKGKGVRVYDIEYGFYDHSGLPPRSVPVAGTNAVLTSSQVIHCLRNVNSPTKYLNHGTGVLGILFANYIQSGVNINGICPDSLKFSLPAASSKDLQKAFLCAINQLNDHINLEKGDIVLLEMQCIYNRKECPAEYDPSIYTGICTLTGTGPLTPLDPPGIIVVEPAGNGSVEIPLTRDSLAIMVGAGMPNNKYWFSNYGDRVDCHAPGYMITTLLHDINNNSDTIRNDFTGTSPAGAIIAGAAALLQSWYKGNPFSANKNKFINPNQIPLTPKQIRDYFSNKLLGTKEISAVHEIGPMPDLKLVTDEILTNPP